MREEDLATLELDSVLNALATFAASEPGAEACRALRPSTDAYAVVAELGRVSDYLQMTASDAPPLGSFPDLRPHLAVARTVAARLAGTELKEIAHVIATARRMRGYLRANAAGLPRLLAFLGSLHALPELDELLSDALDEDGGLRDDASPELRRLRRELRDLRAQIETRLTRLLRQPNATRTLADEYVTVRNGRFVVPVRASAASDLPGIVQDRSASGETLFVEPLFAVDSNNRLLIAAREEAQEEARILTEITARVGTDAEALEDVMRALIELDTLGARAAFARRHEGICPEIGSAEVSLRAARHPLLVLTHRDVTAIDVELGATDRLLLVSGPNTGGKSVALKTLGLSAAMAQAGLPILAQPGATLPLFDAIWTDIGDRQNVAGDLSTFSGHARNLAEILAGATAHSLVLLDEPGTGTDPEDGAALAKVVLAALVERDARVLATTHFQSVKLFALSLPQARVAAVDFDPETFAPLYRLVYGSVGPSLGLSMARRLGLPTALCEAAAHERGAGAADLGNAIDRLEAERRRYEALAAALHAEREELSGSRHEHDRLAAELREKRQRRWADELGEAKAFADEIRSEARRALAEARQRPNANPRDLLAVGRDLAQVIAKKQREVLGASDHADSQVHGGAPLAIGDEVEVRGAAVSGVLAKISGERAQVMRGGIRFDVALSQLVRSHASSQSSARTQARTSPRATARRFRAAAPDEEGAAPPGSFFDAEINLVGERVQSALGRLDSYLDRAVLEARAAVRIIHGHGTGALRGAIREHLTHSPYVARFEEADARSGGAGATIAYLR